MLRLLLFYLLVCDLDSVLSRAMIEISASAGVGSLEQVSSAIPISPPPPPKPLKEAESSLGVSGLFFPLL